MPNIQELASKGIILENHYSQSVCTPSRGSFMTGRYPINIGLQNGVIVNGVPFGIDTQFSLLPQELKRAGYLSHIIGKWHLGICNKRFWPHHRGFNSFYGYLGGGEGYYDHSTRYWSSYFQFLIDDNILRGGYDFRDGDEVNFEVNGTYSTELFQQRAIDIIENHPEDEPLFLYVPFQSVHDPIEVPDEYVDNFEYVDNEKRKKYLGMILAMDEAVGNIIKSLEVFAFFSTHEP